MFRRLIGFVLGVATCVAAGSAAGDEIDDAVRAEFLATATDTCGEAGTGEDTIFPATLLLPGEPANAAPREARIYEFFCYSGPYTVFYAYYLYTRLDGITPVAFAIPDFTVDCITLGDAGCQRARLAVRGGTTAAILANTEFDPTTLVLTARLCWRGPCDAFETGVWVFNGGRFVLVQYEVDATLDGEQKPQRLIDFPIP